MPVTPPPPGSSSLEVTLPQGLTFQGCGGACRRYAGEAAWVQPLDFYHGKATDVFPIKTTNFATDVSGVYAYAAIPQVSFMNPGSQQSPASGSKSLFPVLRAEYRIPAAGSYDWSSGSVPVVTGSTAMWQEIMPTSDLAGQTAAGVDHPRQVHDADFTFLAGFLLGLAGSVVLTGVQLLLPSPAGSGANSGHRTAGG